MLTEIVPNFFLVEGQKKGRFPFSHSFLICNENNQALLIDTGSGIEIIQELIKKYRITQVINTHAHPDHSAGNYLFNQEKIPISVPNEALPHAGNLQMLAQRFASPEPLQQKWINFATTTMGIKPYHEKNTYHGGEVFEFGGFSLEAVYAPGHAIDHYCFLERNHRILIGSDYDLTRFGPWYGHPESSIEQTLDSLKKLKELRPKIFASSHLGIIRETINSRIDEFAAKIFQRDDKILQILENKPLTAGQLLKLKPFYQNYPYAPQLMEYWESQMISKHITRLMDEHQIELSSNGLLSVKN